jgi:hypothetical protein
MRKALAFGVASFLILLGLTISAYTQSTEDDNVAVCPGLSATMCEGNGCPYLESPAAAELLASGCPYLAEVHKGKITDEAKCPYLEGKKSNGRTLDQAPLRRGELSRSL